MFEALQTGQKITREAFDQVADSLRSELLELQKRLKDASFPVLILFAGVDGAGKSETATLLNEWLDPHGIFTRAYDKPSEEERLRPRLWRYWRDLPAKGQIGVLLSGWYSHPVLERVYDKGKRKDFEYRLDRIKAMETMLAEDGALILKFWMHLGKKAQKRQLKALEADPLQSWRIGPHAWRNYRHYDDFLEAAEIVIERTEGWMAIDGEDPRHRSLTVLNVLKERLARHLERKPDPKGTRAPASPMPTVLDRLDLSQKLDAGSDSRLWQEARAELAMASREANQRGIPLVLAFEGWDAAGKGGAIRRVTASMDVRHYDVVPIAAPSEEERAHHYLWRFWRHLPRDGRVAIFDRSWYGRVLVERVEGFASTAEWSRAYGEIRDFEEQLHHHGALLAKFWIHISPDEQYRRFKEREETPYKQWKLTE